jgi:hypothetical protein
VRAAVVGCAPSSAARVSGISKMSVMANGSGNGLPCNYVVPDFSPHLTAPPCPAHFSFPFPQLSVTD